MELKGFPQRFFTFVEFSNVLFLYYSWKTYFSFSFSQNVEKIEKNSDGKSAATRL